MKDLKIVKGNGTYGFGYPYTLYKGDKKITSHFCSCDGFAHGDLFNHDETKEVIGDMTRLEFSNIPIIEGLNDTMTIHDFVKIEFSE